MEWLSPMAGLMAGAVAVPALVVLYFLKLRRREVLVSSTLLWKRAVQDLQVNAPFQRLRRNLLLLLQLLALLALLAALARPVLSLRPGEGKRFVLLIDHSASMNAVEQGRSRLAQAKEQAKALVETLRSGKALALRDESDQAMVISFADHAKVMCNFTSDRRQLHAAIAAIEPSDGGSLLAEAVTVAQAFAQAPGEEANNSGAEAPAGLELFSDGRIGDMDAIVVGTDGVRWHRVGEAGANVAVTVMQARRSYEQADEVNVFAVLANYGEQEVSRDVQLSVDDDVRAVRAVRIAGRKVGSDGVVEPGKVSVSFRLVHEGEGVVEVRQLGTDALGSDDAAWAVLERPRKAAVLLVTEGNTALEGALRACSPARLAVWTVGEYAQRQKTGAGFEQEYDLTVLDGYAGKLPGRGRFLVFGQPPEGMGVSVGGQLEHQMVVDWRQQHPVLHHVNLTNLYAATCYKMVLERDAEILCEFMDTAALALVRRQGSVMLWAGFDVLETNWPFEVGFVMFCYNAMNYLGLELGQGEAFNLRVGEAIRLEGLEREAELQVQRAGGAATAVKSDAEGTLRYPGTQRAGVYRVSGTAGKVWYFAVNLADGTESQIEPAGELTFSGQTVAAESATAKKANVELWPYLVVLAIVLVCGEWMVYNSKVRI